MSVSNRIYFIYVLIAFFIAVCWGGAVRAQDERQPVEFSADHITINRDSGELIATGRVLFSQEPRMSLKAERVEYNRESGQATAIGNVVFTDHVGNIHFAERFELDDQFSRAFAEPIISNMTDKSWLQGKSGQYIKDETIHYKGAVYTPCDCDFADGETPVWRLESTSSHHDSSTQSVYHRNVRLKILDVPVLYLPYLSHPDWTVARRSGLLFPNVSYSSDHGFSYIQSYYHVIDDTSDVEIRPYLFNDADLLTNVTYRKLWDASDLHIDATGGVVESVGQVKRNVVAAMVDFRTHLGEGWKVRARLNRTSQDTFLRRYDINDATRLKSQFLAENVGDNTYSRVESYDIQGLERADTNDREPSVLPSVFHERYLNSPRDNMITRLRFYASQVDNDEGYDISRWSGELYALEEFPSNLGLISLEARTALQFHFIDENPTQNTYTSKLGQVNASFGLGWEQPYYLNYRDMGAVIQPKVKLININAADDADNIPNRDSADFHLDEANLFLLHRYQGQDYIQSGTHVAGGVSANLIDATLGEIAGFLGASYRLSGDAQSGLNATNDDQNLSDILASIRAAPHQNLRFSLAGRFNPHNFSLNETRASLSWIRPGTKLTSTYTRRSESYFSAANLLEEELKIGLEQLLAEGITLNINQTYDRSDGGDLRGDKSTIGIDFSRGLQDCLTISIQYTRDETSDRDIRPEDKISLLLNFKYLGDAVRNGE